MPCRDRRLNPLNKEQRNAMSGIEVNAIPRPWSSSPTAPIYRYGLPHSCTLPPQRNTIATATAPESSATDGAHHIARYEVSTSVATAACTSVDWNALFPSFLPHISAPPLPRGSSSSTLRHARPAQRTMHRMFACHCHLTAISKKKSFDR